LEAEIVAEAIKRDYTLTFKGGEHYTWFRIGQWEAHVQRDDSDCSKLQIDPKNLVEISQL